MKTESIRTPWANDGIIKNSGSHPAPYGDYEPAPLKNGVVQPSPKSEQTLKSGPYEPFAEAYVSVETSVITSAQFFSRDELEGFLVGLSVGLGPSGVAKVSVTTKEWSGEVVERFSGYLKGE